MSLDHFFAFYTTRSRCLGTDALGALSTPPRSYDESGNRLRIYLSSYLGPWASPSNHPLSSVPNLRNLPTIPTIPIIPTVPTDPTFPPFLHPTQPHLTRPTHPSLFVASWPLYFIPILLAGHLVFVRRRSHHAKLGSRPLHSTFAICGLVVGLGFQYERDWTKKRLSLPPLSSRSLSSLLLFVTMRGGSNIS